MITELELNNKYPQNTPYWRKDEVERYVCERHGEPTIYIRDHDMVIHTLTETQCL